MRAPTGGRLVRPEAPTGGHGRSGGTTYNNNGVWWQGPLGKFIFVLFCFGIGMDEEKEIQNINVVSKNVGGC